MPRGDLCCRRAFGVVVSRHSFVPADRRQFALHFLLQPSRAAHFARAGVIPDKRASASSSHGSNALHPAVVEAIVEEANSLLKESQEHWNRGEYTQCAEKCRRVAEELLGCERPNELRDAHHQTVASAYINGACALKALHKHEEALAECEKGLVVLRRRFSKNRQQVVQVLDLLAELCLLCGRIDDAEKHIASALQVKESFPWHRAALAASWNLQAQAKVQRGDLEAAKRLFRRSLAVHAEIAKRQDAGSLPVAAAVVLSNYAGLLREQACYAEAAQLYGKAVEIFEAKLGPENEAVGRTLVELGATYVTAGMRGARAAEPFIRASAVLSNALGADHPSVAATMEWLAKCAGDSSASLLEMFEAPAQSCPVDRLLAEHRADVGR